MLKGYQIPHYIASTIPILSNPTSFPRLLPNHLLHHIPLPLSDIDKQQQQTNKQTNHYFKTLSCNHYKKLSKLQESSQTAPIIEDPSFLLLDYLALLVTLKMLCIWSIPKFLCDLHHGVRWIHLTKRDFSCISFFV